MKINKLILKNFSSFEGENIFDFSIKNSNKNVILIGGQNGAGKTSLFSAIKIALYGPIAFGYVSAGRHYGKKIKEHINSKSFQKDNIEAGVKLEIALEMERETEIYWLERNWRYEDYKIQEEYHVKRAGIELHNEELAFFQNYLQTVIPPELFEFFLFDGEEVGNIFSADNYNKYIKKAIFTVCDLDVFDIIRRYSSNYLSKSDLKEHEDLVKEYELKKEYHTSTLDELDRLEESIEIYKGDLEDNLVQQKELAEQFKNSGGITNDEKQKLILKLEKAEKTKSECSREIKEFFEGLMPFIIIEELAGEIKQDLYVEEEIEKQQYITDVLNVEVVNNALEKVNIKDKELANDLVKELLKRTNLLENQNIGMPKHDLSKSQRNAINHILDQTENIGKSDLLKVIKKKAKATAITVDINKKLRDALDEDDLIRFKEDEEKLKRQYDELTNDVNEALVEVEEKKKFAEQLDKEILKAREEIASRIRNKHAYELSRKVAYAMESVINKKTVRIKKILSELTVRNLGEIYRKNNLITHIELTDNFKFLLYQDEIYQDTELVALAHNLGIKELRDVIGAKGEACLLGNYNKESLRDVIKYLEEYWNGESIKLYKRIDLSRLSKGERQIFILSLYWAIIDLSKKDIPFIIDTPYARIDAKHRSEISSKFFPSISEQVIILSTDEEINREYYEIIKPHIAKEYLLVNDESENRTTVLEKYFYEVQV